MALTSGPLGTEVIKRILEARRAPLVMFEIGARVSARSIASYQFWPPQISERLDAQSIERVRLMVVTAFFGAVPSASASPSSSSSPTPAPGSGSIC